MGTVTAQTLPLLERDEELMAIRASARDALAQTAAVLALEGPPGIGKTRLIEEARGIGRELGMTVLSARGAEIERTFAFGVARQLFEPLLAGEQRDDLLAGAAGLAAAVLADPSDPPRPDPSGAALHGLYWLTANAAARTPLLITLDDAHWADLPSLRWLGYLARRLEGLPVLVVLSLRPRQRSARSSPLAELVHDPLVRVVRPSALSEAGTDDLVRALAGADAAPEFVRACREATGGNPFFVRELLAEGLAPIAENAERLRHTAPEAISRVVLFRLPRLAEGAVEVAQAAAVLGDDSPLRYAAELAGLDASVAGDSADALRAVGIFGPSAALRFTHPVLRTAVYNDIGASERAAMHRHAARMLRTDGAASDRLAAHYLPAEPVGDPDAVATLREAARDALSRGGPESAVTYLERALVEPPGDDRFDVLLELGRAGTIAGSIEHRRYLREAFDAASTPRQFATAGRHLARAEMAMPGIADPLAVADRVVREASESEPGLALLVEAQITTLVWFETGDRSVLRRLDRFALPEEPRSAGERLLVAIRALEACSSARPRRESAELARRSLQDGLTLLETMEGAPHFLFMTRVLAAADDIDGALELTEAARRKAQAHGSALLFATASTYCAEYEHWRGNLAAAEVNARSALELFGGSPAWTWGARSTTGLLAEALAQRGEVSAAVELVRAPNQPRRPHLYGEAGFLHYKGRVLLAHDPEAALAALLECGDRLATFGESNPACYPWRSSATIALLRLGQTQRALELAREELALAEGTGSLRAIGTALRAVGLATGEERGVEVLQRAVETLARSPARLEHARALADLGAALRRTGQRAAAREPLRAALDIAAEVGAVPLVDYIRTELLATGARPRRDRFTGRDALTPSEKRVAAMAGDGMANREIAQALFVTAKTVETHLGRVYRKLDIASRTELADALASEP